MATIDELRALQLENAEADSRFWEMLGDMQREQAQGQRGIAKKAEQHAVDFQSEAESADAHAATAKERVDRLKRGEPIAGGYAKPFDPIQCLREWGFTRADIKRLQAIGEISRLGGAKEYEDELIKVHARLLERLPNQVARAVLRRLKQSR